LRFAVQRLAEREKMDRKKEHEQHTGHAMHDESPVRRVIA
jgi:hypothetical protein